MEKKASVKVTKEEIERARLLSELKYELDMQSLRVEAVREDKRRH